MRDNAKAVAEAVKTTPTEHMNVLIEKLIAAVSSGQAAETGGASRVATGKYGKSGRLVAEEETQRYRHRNEAALSPIMGIPVSINHWIRKRPLK